MKCDIYLKLWSYAQNCLICTLHPFYCEKKLSIRYGAHKPVRVSCSHCHVVDVMNDIILCSYTGFVLNVCLLNRCGKCTYMVINTFWIWILNLNVIALFKKGSKRSPNNYRPVSLTAICCKVLEKLIRDAIMDTLESQGLIDKDQHGFRSGRSCLTQLLEVMEIWTKWYDLGLAWDTVYTDLYSTRERFRSCFVYYLH